jgi:hypothetical protein
VGLTHFFYGNLQIPTAPCQPTVGCYSGAVARVQWGVAHFENASPYHTFVNEITTVLHHAVDKG